MRLALALAILLSSSTAFAAETTEYKGLLLDCENIFGASCRDKCEPDEVMTPGFEVRGQIMKAACKVITYNQFELLQKKGITLVKDGRALTLNDPILETNRVCCLKKSATTNKP